MAPADFSSCMALDSGTSKLRVFTAFLLILFCSFLLQLCHGRSLIVLGQPVVDSESLSSSGEIFELEFFVFYSLHLTPLLCGGTWFEKVIQSAVLHGRVLITHFDDEIML